MIKFFLKILFTLIFLRFLTEIAFGNVTLLTPKFGEVLDDQGVYFTWQQDDSQEQYIFRHIVYTSGYVNGTSTSRTLEANQLARGLVTGRIYFWKVQYHPKATFDGDFDFETDMSVFSIKREIPEEILQEYQIEEEEEQEEEELEEDIEQEEEDIKKEVVKKEESVDIVNETVQEHSEPIMEILRRTEPIVTIQDTVQKRRTAVQENEFQWNVTGTQAVLGVSKKEEIVCKFRYVNRSKTLEKIFCNIPEITIKEQFKYPFGNDYLIYLTGEVVTNYNIQVDEYDCNVALLRPRTWFRCEEEFVKSTLISLQPHMLFDTYRGNQRVPVRSFTLNGNEFTLLAGYVRDVRNMELVHKYRMLSNKYDLYYQIEKNYPLTPTLFEEEKEEKSKKPFSFPFSRIIGVTQWYGYTTYQSPHAGIDFGARKENILAVGDGQVVSKGWDGYGKCLSGGNYLIIKHNNGMHTTYFHLEEMYVDTGDIVKGGDIIARSGNTGAWNCQPLGYHLHFETRLSASPRSHSNPVKYIDVDWNKIPTLGYQQFPGRLTGENPHPGR